MEFVNLLNPENPYPVITEQAVSASFHASASASSIVSDSSFASASSIAAASASTFADAAASGPLILGFLAAALAGLVSFASPCVVPLVPGYIS